MRVKARAVIFLDGQLVVVRQRRQGRPQTALPGGRPKRGETTAEVVVREVQEETGLSVSVERLLYVAEVTAPFRRQEMNLVFLATVSGSAEGQFALVDPAAPGEPVVPPILDEIARDYPTDWVDAPRWLGNVWDPALVLR